MKSLSREGFKILNILDTTRVPRGGPKKKAEEEEDVLK